MPYHHLLRAPHGEPFFLWQRSTHWLTPILEAVDINVAKWVEGVERYESLTCRVVGHIEAVCRAAQRSTVKFFKGRGLCGDAFVAHEPVPG